MGNFAPVCTYLPHRCRPSIEHLPHALAMTDMPDCAGFPARPVSPDDLDLICRHREAMFLEAGGIAADLGVMSAHFRPWLRERLADGRYYGFVLLDAGIPIAGIGLMTLDWPPHPNHPEQDRRGYVLNVYVEPGHRRRGLASALMELADAEFARRGVGFAVLHATDAGRPVYAGLGWQATAEMAKRIG